jgi:hypothetical protein
MRNQNAGVGWLIVAASLLLVPATAGAQPQDPYGDEVPPDMGPPPADPEPPPGATTDERDPEVDEAVAASLVARAKELMATASTSEEWADAKQLLGEAVVRSPDGAAAAEAQELIEQVNVKLGILPKEQPEPIDPYIGMPIDDEPIVDPEPMPLPEQPTRKAGGKKFLLHAASIGAVIGGFLGDVASADTKPSEEDGDPVNTESAGGVVAGVLLGGLAGLAVGAGFRNAQWMTTDDIAVIDSFAGMGMMGSLSLGGVMQPAEAEGYSMNAVIGTTVGTATGFYIAKNRNISGRRIGRVDLWAATGALVPWAIFAVAQGNQDGAQVAGFFSLAGMVGGAWLGFRLTRDWDDEPGPAATADAPMAMFRRHSDGGWTLGAPTVQPLPEGGASLGVLSGRW